VGWGNYWSLENQDDRRVGPIRSSAYEFVYFTLSCTQKTRTHRLLPECPGFFACPTLSRLDRTPTCDKQTEVQTMYWTASATDNGCILFSDDDMTSASRSVGVLAGGANWGCYGPSLVPVLHQPPGGAQHPPAPPTLRPCQRVRAEPGRQMHFRAIHSPKFADLLMLMMLFDDALTRANFSFVAKYYYFNTIGRTCGSACSSSRPGTTGATRWATRIRPISCHVASLSWQEPEEELNKLLLMKVSDTDRNVKVKCWLCWSNKLSIFAIINQPKNMFHDSALCIFYNFIFWIFWHFSMGGLNPQASPLATPLSCCYRAAFAVACSRRLTESEELDNERRSLCNAQVCVQRWNNSSIAFRSRCLYLYVNCGNL